MWKCAYVGVYQLLNWKMHGETLKPAEKIQVIFKSDKNNGYCTWRNVYNYDNISINSS